MAQLTPEIQSQLDEQKKNCVFCKIISGQTTSHKLYEDDTVIAILDINPAAKGHVLIVPKEHYPILPYLPPETFQHVFGLLGPLAGALKKCMLASGVAVFIANGGAAGQQSPHFLIHLIARDKDDGITVFDFDGGYSPTAADADELKKMLAPILAQLMKNPSAKLPADQNTLYADEKISCHIPPKPLCKGHIALYPHGQHTALDTMPEEFAVQFFSAASQCASALFEGVKAQATNLILKSGISDDNLQGTLSLHLIPRSAEDGINLTPKPLAVKPNPDEIAAKIRDEAFIIEHASKKKKETLPQKTVPTDYSALIQKVLTKKQKKELGVADPLDEIESAITEIKR